MKNVKSVSAATTLTYSNVAIAIYVRVNAYAVCTKQQVTNASSVVTVSSATHWHKIVVNVIAVFWVQIAPFSIVIDSVVSVRVCQMSRAFDAISALPIIGKLPVAKDVNRVIVMKLEPKTTNAIRTMDSVDAGLVLVDDNVTNVKQTFGVIRTKNVIVANAIEMVRRQISAIA